MRRQRANADKASETGKRKLYSVINPSWRTQERKKGKEKNSSTRASHSNVVALCVVIESHFHVDCVFVVDNVAVVVFV